MPFNETQSQASGFQSTYDTPYPPLHHVPTLGRHTRKHLLSTTPVKHKKITYYLNCYDPSAKQFLADGFHHGFRINFMGCTPKQHRYNLKSANVNPDTVNQKLSGEIAATRIAGPFVDPPFKNLVISPLALVPKKVPNTYVVIVLDAKPRLYW